jgi:hypothetical protein
MAADSQNPENSVQDVQAHGLGSDLSLDGLTIARKWPSLFAQAQTFSSDLRFCRVLPNSAN